MHPSLPHPPTITGLYTAHSVRTRALKLTTMANMSPGAGLGRNSELHFGHNCLVGMFPNHFSSIEAQSTHRARANNLFQTCPALKTTEDGITSSLGLTGLFKNIASKELKLCLCSLENSATFPLLCLILFLNPDCICFGAQNVQCVPKLLCMEVNYTFL